MAVDVCQLVLVVQIEDLGQVLVFPDLLFDELGPELLFCHQERSDQVGSEHITLTAFLVRHGHR